MALLLYNRIRGGIASRNIRSSHDFTANQNLGIWTRTRISGQNLVSNLSSDPITAAEDLITWIVEAFRLTPSGCILSGQLTDCTLEDYISRFLPNADDQLAKKNYPVVVEELGREFCIQFYGIKTVLRVALRELLVVLPSFYQEKQNPVLLIDLLTKVIYRYLSEITSSEPKIIGSFDSESKIIGSFDSVPKIIGSFDSEYLSSLLKILRLDNPPPADVIKPDTLTDPFSKQCCADTNQSLCILTSLVFEGLVTEYDPDLIFQASNFTTDFFPLYHYVKFRAIDFYNPLNDALELQLKFFPVSSQPWLTITAPLLGQQPPILESAPLPEYLLSNPDLLNYFLEFFHILEKYIAEIDTRAETTINQTADLSKLVSLRNSSLKLIRALVEVCEPMRPVFVVRSIVESVLPILSKSIFRLKQQFVKQHFVPPKDDHWRTFTALDSNCYFALEITLYLTKDPTGLEYFRESDLISSEFISLCTDYILLCIDVRKSAAATSNRGDCLRIPDTPSQRNNEDNPQEYIAFALMLAIFRQILSPESGIPGIFVSRNLPALMLALISYLKTPSTSELAAVFIMACEIFLACSADWEDNDTKTLDELLTTKGPPRWNADESALDVIVGMAITSPVVLKVVEVIGFLNLRFREKLMSSLVQGSKWASRAFHVLEEDSNSDCACNVLRIFGAIITGGNPVQSQIRASLCQIRFVNDSKSLLDLLTDLANDCIATENSSDSEEEQARTLAFEEFLAANDDNSIQHNNPSVKCLITILQILINWSSASRYVGALDYTHGSPKRLYKPFPLNVWENLNFEKCIFLSSNGMKLIDNLQNLIEFTDNKMLKMLSSYFLIGCLGRGFQMNETIDIASSSELGELFSVDELNTFTTTMESLKYDKRIATLLNLMVVAMDLVKTLLPFAVRASNNSSRYFDFVAQSFKNRSSGAATTIYPGLNHSEFVTILDSEHFRCPKKSLTDRLTRSDIILETTYCIHNRSTALAQAVATACRNRQQAPTGEESLALENTLRKILDEKLTVIKRAAPSQLDEMSKEQLISIIGDLATKVTLLKAAIETQNTAFQAPPATSPGATPAAGRPGAAHPAAAGQSPKAAPASQSPKAAAAGQSPKAAAAGQSPTAAAAGQSATDGIQRYNKMPPPPAGAAGFYSHIPVRFPQTTSVLEQDSIPDSRSRPEVGEQQTRFSQDFRAECDLLSYGSRPNVRLSPQDAGATQIPGAAFLRQSEMNYLVPIASGTIPEGDTKPPFPVDRLRRFENDDLCGFQPNWIS